MNTIIDCKHLVKRYGKKVALRDINLEVPAGTIYALLGTNGAGKTTLIRTILGLIPVSDGEVRVLGEEPYRFGPEIRQKIGYVSEVQGLYEWMKVRDIIGFCKSLYQQWNNLLVQKYLELFDLRPDTRIGALSKGQTTKLALILALAPKPELLILDEPMSGLDPVAHYQFLQVLLKDVYPDGRTIFFSTHNLADVEAIATEVAIVFGGRIQAHGSIEAVCSQVKKLKVKIDTTVRDSITLETNRNEKTILIPAESINEIAVAAETEISDIAPASLTEAFIFFCSRGGEEYAELK